MLHRLRMDGCKSLGGLYSVDNHPGHWTGNISLGQGSRRGLAEASAAVTFISQANASLSFASVWVGLVA